jgi:hypothetical protein
MSGTWKRMFSTYYEDMAKKVAANKDGYEDYKDAAPPNQLFAVCKCKGRPPQGGPYCSRNPNKETRSNGYCIWYTLPNGNDSMHCNHSQWFAPKES